MRNDEGTIDAALDVMAAAWGKQSGYALFPSIRGDAKDKAERIKSYREGKAWRWPVERDAIAEWLKGQRDNDVYWCPVLFEYPRRRGDLAMDEKCLWADLDGVDPRGIEEWPPTVAWETSPGRWQALWLVGPGADMQGASWPGNENQRLTKALGADPSGWDTTQLLRIPQWINHKPEHRGPDGSPPPVGGYAWPRWRSRRRWYLDDFETLPEVPRPQGMDAVVENLVEDIDVPKLWTQTRLKVKPATRQIFSARFASGDRSETLWGLERDLANAGLNATEIVALVRSTAWNKYVGRQDEFKRLVLEANKAIAMKDAEQQDRRKIKAKSGAATELEVIDDEDEDRVEFQDFMVLLENVKPPEWLVDNVWTEGACGFIAGQPKVHKSWCALDLALSVATGMPFLRKFAVRRPGPVLYVQEEDPAGEIKRRFTKMWDDKRADRIVNEDGVLYWEPTTEMKKPDMRALIQGGMILSDLTWQARLDEELERGYDGNPYRMVVLDPLLMMLGDVDDNKGGQITEGIYKPLKVISKTHGVAICIVHHMRKGSTEGRGGQLMLGSVANHAWAQDALYLSYPEGKARNGTVEVERESKSASYFKFNIKGITTSKRWDPVITDVRGLWDDDDEPKPKDELEPRRKAKRTDPQVNPGGDDRISLLSELQRELIDILNPDQLMKDVGKRTLTVNEIAEITDRSPKDLRAILNELERQGILHRQIMNWGWDRTFHGQS